MSSTETVPKPDQPIRGRNHFGLNQLAQWWDRQQLVRGSQSLQCHHNWNDHLRITTNFSKPNFHVYCFIIDSFQQCTYSFFRNDTFMTLRWPFQYATVIPKNAILSHLLKKMFFRGTKLALLITELRVNMAKQASPFPLFRMYASLLKSTLIKKTYLSQLARIGSPEQKLKLSRWHGTLLKQRLSR